MCKHNKITDPGDYRAKELYRTKFVCKFNLLAVAALTKAENLANTIKICSDGEPFY